MCERRTISEGRSFSSRAETSAPRSASRSFGSSTCWTCQPCASNREADRRRPVDRDVVVVVDVDQAAEAEVARDRRGLLRDALHQVAVRADGVDPRVDDGVSRPVPALREERLRDREPDAVPEALPERPRRRLDARRVVELGMAGRPRPPLAELLQVVERQVVAREVEGDVLEDARVPGREDEPVAPGPFRLGRIVSHLLGVEQVRDGGERHRRARVAGVRLLHRVHREHADGVDREADGVGRGAHPANTTPREGFATRQRPRPGGGSRRGGGSDRRPRAVP
jgi:hypothetical protein